MHLSKEQLEQTREMAYRCFAPQMIAINLMLDEEDFTEAIMIPGSPVRHAYYSGLIRQQMELRDSIIKSAHNGSNPAQEQLLKMITQLTGSI